MDSLPGGRTGAQSGSALADAVLVFLGGQRVSTAIHALMGARRGGRISELKRHAGAQLERQGFLEFRDVGPADRDAAQELVVGLLERAAKALDPVQQQDFQAAALMGTDHLAARLLDGPGLAARAELSVDAQAYVDTFLRLVAAAICQWYDSDEKAGQSASRAAQGAILRQLLIVQSGPPSLQSAFDDMRAELRAYVHKSQADSEPPQCVSSARPVALLDPLTLGVHSPIELGDTTELPPYLAREHDERLRALLRDLTEAGSGPAMVVVVGTSCTGKTRTAFEALRTVLPDWPVVQPARGTSQLLTALRAGIPDRHVVWLDEIQDYVNLAPSGVEAAEALLSVLRDESASLLVITTAWESTLLQLQHAEDPEIAAEKGSAVARLLEATARWRCVVPEAFTSTELAAAAAGTDRRMAEAARTAARGRMIQVLGGGSALVEKYTATTGNRFTPAAKAVITAAMDLRRVGHPNPLPVWVIAGAAPGYLPIEAYADVTEDWIARGLSEAATRVRGIAALSPRATLPAQIDAYELHDYLLQHYLTSEARRPTTVALWESLLRVAAAEALTPDAVQAIASNALHRGLFAYAIALISPLSLTGDRIAVRTLDDALAGRGQLAALESRAAAGDYLAADVLAPVLAVSGDIDGLRTLAAGPGTGYARDLLAQELARRGDVEELAARADAGDGYALYRLDDLLSRRGDLPALQARADAGDGMAEDMLTRVDDLDDLRELADSGDRQHGLAFAATLADRGRLEELEARAAAGDAPAREVLDLIARRDTPGRLAELRELADRGDPAAREALAESLLRLGERGEVRDRAARGEAAAQRRLVRDLARDGSPEAVEELRQCVHAAYEEAARQLLAVYRREHFGVALDLNVDAKPVPLPLA